GLRFRGAALRRGSGRGPASGEERGRGEKPDELKTQPEFTSHKVSPSKERCPRDPIAARSRHARKTVDGPASERLAGIEAHARKRRAVRGIRKVLRLEAQAFVTPVEAAGLAPQRPIKTSAGI